MIELRAWLDTENGVNRMNELNALMVREMDEEQNTKNSTVHYKSNVNTTSEPPKNKVVGSAVRDNMINGR